MTSLSGTGTPRGADALGRDALYSRQLNPRTRCRSSVAPVLLTCRRVALCAALLGSSICVAACLPPDFEIVPRENHPVSIDKALLTPSPDQYQDILPACDAVVFDLSNSIIDDDKGDPQTIAWLVDYSPGQSVQPDSINFKRFTFDPCTNPKAARGEVSTVEALVFDRPIPLDVLANADLLKEYVADDVTSDSVVWFVGFEVCDKTSRCPQQ